MVLNTNNIFIKANLCNSTFIQGTWVELLATILMGHTEPLRGVRFSVSLKHH